MDPVVAAALTAVGMVALFVVFLAANGGVGRFGLGLQVMRNASRDPEFARKLDLLLNPPPPEPPKPVKPSGAPLRMLTVMQRECRLIDFLMENLSGANDGQIAAAVRDIQPKAQASLKKHLVIENVMSQTEGDEVEVQEGFDPSALQLVGNVTGKPPFRGVLRHSGWRVKEIKLVTPPEGSDEFVLAPAEVEMQ